MRIQIRWQLASLLLLSSLIGLGILAIAVWISNHDFVLSIRATRLSLTASLKAAQLTANLNLLQTTSQFVSTRVVIQAALQRYNDDGNNSHQNWVDAAADMAAAIGGSNSQGQTLLLQTILFPKNASGPAGYSALLNTTSTAIPGEIKLPYKCPNGATAVLGMHPDQCGGLNLGYPPALYPNLTYLTATYNDTHNVQQAEYDGDVIGPGAQTALLIGPYTVNSTFSMLSLTLPIINNTSAVGVLGWLTVVVDAKLIRETAQSTVGLDTTAETLLLGPNTETNLFSNGILYNSNHGNPPQNFMVRYVMPLNSSDASRHPDHVIGSPNPPFKASKYPAVMQAFTVATGQQDNSGAKIRARNEAGQKVSVGYAMAESSIVNWVVLVEEAQSEVWQPINRLRDIILACVFATAGFMAIVAFPLAHFASLPIRRLREATAKSIEPPGQSLSRSSLGSLEDSDPQTLDGEADAEAVAVVDEKKFKNPVKNWQKKRQQDRGQRREARARREFRIPDKVKERKSFIKDELSDLTRTFNEMSDELMMQYTKLEERVQQRTAELEQSKKAAEAANESKTLFIANISHELKTPLNGILGMCAVCMQEDDPIRLKRSLGIIYKSGDLLLNLLTDLLTFSKNQVGQQLSLDEREFRLRDISSQILAIFDKQATEGNIDLRVEWEGVQHVPPDGSSPERTAFGPQGTGRMKDMILWGDSQRILQVVINLVSNSLKFTPSGGSVVLTLRCLPDISDTESRKGSLASRRSRQNSSRHKGSDVTLSTIGRMDTANAINAKDKPNALAHPYGHDRTPSPPPGMMLTFEFQVQDTGPGIPEHLHAKIFEPFVQGDLGLSKKFGGTGLGLSICSQLAGLMRGNIGVESTIGQGSTFTMRIPLRHLKSRADSSASSSVDVPSDLKTQKSGSFDDAEKVPARYSRHLAAEENVEEKNVSAPASSTTVASDSQPRLVGLSQPFFAASQPMESPGSQPAAMEKIAAEVQRSGEKIRVLVAEDNKVNQEVVLRMLKLEDIYDVTVAKDGQEALDFVKESMTPLTPGGSGDERKPFNLIFMDVQMPNVDGLQSTRLIREIGYNAPIVALTAFAEESNIKDCYDSGMNYFLSKPIRRPQLKKVLKEYIAPIPEESEEPSPDEASTKPGGQTTTVVLRDKSPRPSLQRERPQFDPESDMQPLEQVPSNDDANRPVSPVSPLTKQ